MYFVYLNNYLKYAIANACMHMVSLLVAVAFELFFFSLSILPFNLFVSFDISTMDLCGVLLLCMDNIGTHTYTEYEQKGKS